MKYNTERVKMMKKCFKVIALALILVMCLSLCVSVSAFNISEEDYYDSSINGDVDNLYAECYFYYASEELGYLKADGFYYLEKDDGTVEVSASVEFCENVEIT